MTFLKKCWAMLMDQSDVVRIAASITVAVMLAATVYYGFPLFPNLGVVRDLLYGYFGGLDATVRGLATVSMATIAAALAATALCSAFELRRRVHGLNPRTWEDAAGLVDFLAFIVLWLTSAAIGLVCCKPDGPVGTFNVLCALILAPALLALLAGTAVSLVTVPKRPIRQHNPVMLYAVKMSVICITLLVGAHSTVILAMFAGMAVLAVLLSPVGLKVSWLRMAQVW